VNASTAYLEPAALLRDALGRFATGVTVITTLDRSGHPTGTTATAIASLSLEPPLVLVCLGRGSATREAILDYGAFAINVLSDEQEELSANFARSAGDASWDDCVHDHWESGCPRLAGTLASVDCCVEQAIDGGDHEILIGRVRDAGADAGAAQPLLHWRGRYHGLEAR
jgi:flavin reductase (DIM6/NTAB) family NADH-FMN oxidoreductase RutF